MSERFHPDRKFTQGADDSDKESAPDSGRKNPEYDLPDEVIEARREEAKRFIKHNQMLFAGIAGDTSLQFELGDWFMIDLKKGTVYLGEETFITGPEKGWSREQIFWAVCHELSHFRDLRENPKKMLENFQYMWDRSAELAPQVLDILREKMGGTLPDYLTKPVPFDDKGKTVPWIETYLYKQLHALYNGLDDMYVNVKLPERTPLFRADSQHGPEVERLYRDILFPTDPKKKGQPPLAMQAADYSTHPKSSQLVNYVLRRRMVPDQDILISQEVQDVLDGYPNEAFQDVGMTLNDIIDSITDSGSRDAIDPGWRYEHIRSEIEPIWLEFFLKDIEVRDAPKPKPKKRKKNEKGGEEPEEPEESDEKDQPNGWPDTDDGNPEPIDIHVTKDFLDQQRKKAEDERKEEARKKAFERLSPDEKRDVAKKLRDAKLCEQHAIDPTWAEAYRTLEESIEPYRRDLEGVFEGFMKAIEARMTTFMLQGFRSGKLDVNAFVRKYGIELTLEKYDQIPWDSLDVYIQKELESRFEIKPNEISVRLVIDGSGSMYDGVRIEAAKQLAVLFLEGFSSFEMEMNRKFRMRNPLKVNTEVWIFGSPGQAQIIKPFEDEMSEDERAKRFRMIGELSKSRGGTCEAEPLWMIEQSVSTLREEKLRAGKSVEFLFAVTDGGSFGPSHEGLKSVQHLPMTEEVEVDGQKFSVYTQAMQDATNALEALRQKGAHVEAGEQFDGIIARGFQIGERKTEERLREIYGRIPKGTTKNPKPSFEKWRSESDHGFLADWEAYQFQKVWGEHGANVPHAKDLAPAASKMLRDEIDKLQIKIKFYEVDSDEAEDVL